MWMIGKIALGGECFSPYIRFSQTVRKAQSFIILETTLWSWMHSPSQTYSHLRP